MMAIIAEKRLTVEDNAFLYVYIWDGLSSMNSFTGLDGNYKACYKAPTGNDGKDVCGTIHLVNGEFGGGLFAHELQHFIQAWIANNGMDPAGKDWETIPQLVGDLTNQFWVWFTDVFQVGDA